MRSIFWWNPFGADTNCRMLCCAGVLYIIARGNTLGTTIRAFDLSRNIVSAVRKFEGNAYVALAANAGLCVLPDKLLYCDRDLHVVRAVDKATGAVSM